MKKQNHKITIEKLGPIEEITFEVRSVNAVIGKSATGKSLLAKAIYCFNEPEFIGFIYDDLEEAEALLRYNLTQLFGPYQGFSIKYQYTDDYYISVEKQYNAQYDLEGKPIPWASEKSLLIEISDKLKSNIKRIIKKTKQIDRKDQLKSFQELILKAEQRDIADQPNIRDLVNEIPKETKESIAIKNEALDELNILPTVFIPATRSFVTDFDDIRLGRPRFYHRRRASRMNPGIKPYEDMVLTIFSDVYSEYKRGFDILDHPLMQGKVQKINGDGLKFIVKDSDQVLDISEISSGQKEMFPILMILQELKRQGTPSLIIVEEPEAHIYPEDQKILLDHIIEVAKATDSKVFVTTHAPYALMAINNLMEAKSRNYKDLKDRFVDIKETNVAILKGGKYKDLIDRDPEEELIDLGPIEEIEDEIVEEFHKILNS